MSNREKKNTKGSASALGAAAGSLVGVAGGKAAVNQINIAADRTADDSVVPGAEAPCDNISTTQTEPSHNEPADDVEVTGYSNGDLTHANVVEPGTQQVTPVSTAEPLIRAIVEPDPSQEPVPLTTSTGDYPDPNDIFEVVDIVDIRPEVKPGDWEIIDDPDPRPEEILCIYGPPELDPEPSNFMYTDGPIIDYSPLDELSEES